MPPVKASDLWYLQLLRGHPTRGSPPGMGEISAGSHSSERAYGGPSRADSAGSAFRSSSRIWIGVGLGGDPPGAAGRRAAVGPARGGRLADREAHLRHPARRRRVSHGRHQLRVPARAPHARSAGSPHAGGRGSPLRPGDRASIPRRDGGLARDPVLRRGRRLGPPGRARRRAPAERPRGLPRGPPRLRRVRAPGDRVAGPAPRLSRSASRSCRARSAPSLGTTVPRPRCPPGSTRRAEPWRPWPTSSSSISCRSCPRP